MPDIIKAKMWAVGGGKGGVGKSFIASNLACGLALKGFKVVIVDADLAGANIHTLFGIRYPAYTLNDYLKKKVEKFSDILIPTSTEGLHIICGAYDMLDIANPKYAQKQKIIRGIASLNADYIIIDIGAGATLNNMDFFNLADIGIIVATPAPTSMQNAYAFLKMAVQRKLLSMFPDNPVIREKIALAGEKENGLKNMTELIELVRETDAEASWAIIKMLLKGSYRLLVNMATEAEGEKVSNAMSGVTSKFLRIKIPHVGTIGFSPEVEVSIRKMTPLTLTGNIEIRNAILKIVGKITADARGNVTEKSPTEVLPKNEDLFRAKEGIASVQICLNDEILHDGIKLHIQTEDLGAEKAKILSLVFRGGRILFSKSSNYSELSDTLQQTVAEKVRWQHKAIIAGINAGKLNNRITDEGVK